MESFTDEDWQGRLRDSDLNGVLKSSLIETSWQDIKRVGVALIELISFCLLLLVTTSQLYPGSCYYIKGSIT